MRRLLYAGLCSLGLVAGCKPEIQPAPTPPSAAAVPVTAITADKSDVPVDMVAEVRNVLAGLLKVPLEKIDVDRTFSELGADELDFVELVMEAEERFNVAISEEDVGFAGPNAAKGGSLNRLTPREFAANVARLPKQPPAKQVERPADGSLYDGQIGRMADLRKLPNPKGYILEPVPSLDFLIVNAENKSQRKLTAEEIQLLEENAMVIAFPPEVAAKLREQRAKRLAEGHE